MNEKFLSPPSHVESIFMKTDEPIEYKRSRSWRETTLAAGWKHEQNFGGVAAVIETRG